MHKFTRTLTVSIVASRALTVEDQDDAFRGLANALIGKTTGNGHGDSLIIVNASPSQDSAEGRQVVGERNDRIAAYSDDDLLEAAQQVGVARAMMAVLDQAEVEA